MHVLSALIGDPDRRLWHSVILCEVMEGAETAERMATTQRLERRTTALTDQRANQ